MVKINDSGIETSRRQNIIFLLSWLKKKINIVAPLVADPPQCNNITMHCRLVCQDRNIVLGKQPICLVLQNRRNFELIMQY